jgi:hypothetical protein
VVIRHLTKTLAVSAALATGNGAQAQNGFDGSGFWYCSTVLYQAGLQPYGYEAELAAQPDGSLFGRGVVFDPNLANAMEPFEGPGDWSAFPEAGGTLLRYRIHTQTRGIMVFEGYVSSPGTIYVRVTIDGGEAETQCQRRG